MFDYAPKVNLALWASERYKELEGMPAWQDYQAQILATRKAIIYQLLTPGGTMDKWGKPHDEEKKAILAFIETILAHTVQVHGRADQLIAVEQKVQEQKAKNAYAPTGPLHGEDLMFEGGL